MYNRIDKTIGLAFFILLTVGCATTPLTRISRFIEPSSTHHRGEDPKWEVVNEVNVGETIYIEFDYFVIKGGERSYKVAYLSDGYTGSFGLGKIIIDTGNLLTGFVDSNGGEQYCTVTLAYHDPLVGPYGNVCFSDTSNDGFFDRERVVNIMGGAWYNADNIPYKVEQIQEGGGISVQEKGLKYELIYQGVSGGSLKIGFREYIDNMARPAFFQEVQYDMSPPNGVTEINFKGAEIEIVHADNSKIRYIVKKGFRSR